MTTCIAEVSTLTRVAYEVRVAGRFKMDRMIGSGSFGEIYMARDVQTDVDVAIKFE